MKLSFSLFFLFFILLVSLSSVSAAQFGFTSQGIIIQTGAGGATGDCPSGQFVQNITTSEIQCAASSGSGDITAVNAGTGLTGGGDNGDVTLNVDADSCGANEISKYNGTHFNCVTDQTGGAGGGQNTSGVYLYNDSTTHYFNTTLAGTNLSVNSSDYWDDYDDTNSTHFENTAGSLTIIYSWLTDFINSIIGNYFDQSLNTTDDVTFRNITANNITADYYFGNGSQLEGLTLTETDPLWTGNQSSYFNTTDILGFSYYNSTNFSISDYYLKSNPFGFYNSTNFSILDYYLKSNPFGFYNSTNPQTETDPLWTTNESNIARTGDCPSGQFVQNTTTSGVECLAPSGSGDITGVYGDNIYVYNGSASGEVYLEFNETRLNETIDLRDTNETTRTDTITGTDCGAGNYSYGFDASGNIQCRVDETAAGGGNPFDQSLNTTDNVLFNILNVTGIIRAGDWANVSITESQISDLSHTKVNTITCGGTDKFSAYDNSTGTFTCTTDESGGGSYDLNVSGDVGSGVIIDSEIFAISGSGSVSTDMTDNTLTIAGTDTNETSRFDNLTGYDCGGTDKVVGIYDNGTVLCGADQTGAGGGLEGDGTYIYNDTSYLYLNTTLADTNLSVNKSDYWDNADTTNSTHFEIVGGQLRLILSYLQGLFIELADTFGGDVSGTYDNLQLETNVVGDNELNYTEVTLADFTNDNQYVTQTYGNSTYLKVENEGNLNVNSSSYWDGLNSPSNINTADLTDDNTYVTVNGDTMTGNLNMNTLNLTFQSEALNITSNSTCVKIYGATSILEIC